MKNILPKLQLIIYASVLATFSYGQVTTSGISKVLYYEPFNFNLSSETRAEASTIIPVAPATGFVSGSTVNGTVTLNNDGTGYPKPYNFASTPSNNDCYLGLWNDKPVNVTFSGIDISKKSNLALSFAFAQRYDEQVASRPRVFIRIDGGSWIPLLTTGFNTQWPTITVKNTFTGIILPITDADGVPLIGSVLDINFVTSADVKHTQVDDIAVLGDDAPVAGSGPPPVPVTVYTEPFNLSFTGECFPCYASTTLGFSNKAVVGGQFAGEPNAYAKKYTSTTSGNDNFIAFWGDKYTDLTFSGINISGVSDLAVNFGFAQYTMTTASSLPQVEISIDGSDWLRITKAGNGTQWGTTLLSNTFVGVSLPVKYGNSPLTGSALSMRFYGLNGGQIDDLKIIGTTVAGVVTTTPGVVSVTGITVGPNSGSGSIVNGNTIQMKATVLPANASNKNVTWSVTAISTNGTISGTGLFTPVGVGTVSIKATANDGSGKSGSFIVTVTALTFNVSSVTIAPADPNFVLIKIGETAQFVASVLPENATIKTVEWSVFAPTGSKALAVIDQEGLLTTFTVADGGGVGSLKIVATSIDPLKSTDTLKIYVSSPITGIDDSDLDPDFTLYPNPATTELSVKNVQSIKSVVVYDLIGVPVSSAAYLGGHINIAGLVSGTYFVKITSLSGKTRLKTFIKY